MRGAQSTMNAVKRAGIESFNRQRKKRFVFCRDEDGTSTVEFGETATDANVTFGAK